MKLTLLIGDQPRHFFLALMVIEKYPNSTVIVMEREEMIPEPPIGTTLRDANLFWHHFETRRLVEEVHFGTTTIKQIKELASVQIVPPDQLNTAALAEALTEINPDVCIVFGTDLIKDPVLGALPTQTFNVHLGLSPWYRGSATLSGHFISWNRSGLE